MVAQMCAVDTTTTEGMTESFGGGKIAGEMLQRTSPATPQIKTAWLVLCS